MADRATGGAGKPPLYKIVMLGDSGVGKTSLGMLYEFLLLFIGDKRNFLTVQFCVQPAFDPQLLVLQTLIDL